MSGSVEAGRQRRDRVCPCCFEHRGQAAPSKGRGVGSTVAKQEERRRQTNADGPSRRLVSSSSAMRRSSSSSSFDFFFFFPIVTPTLLPLAVCFLNASADT